MRNRAAAGVAQARRRVAQLPAPSATNPYAELLYRELAEYGYPRETPFELTISSLWRARREVGYLHFQWRIDRLYAPSLGNSEFTGWRRGARAAVQLGRFAVRLSWARMLGYRIVWTMHPRSPRRDRLGEWIERTGLSLTARASSVMLTHHDAVANTVRRDVGRPLRVELVPHGDFRDAHPRGRSRAAVRAQLGIPADAFVFLCFGHLRADKQLDLVFEALASLDLPDVRLMVAGRRENEDTLEMVRRSALQDDRVVLIAETIAHERVRELFEMADVFVLARGEAWCSGSLVLALSLGLPVIAAELPPTLELLAGHDAGWLFRPDDVESLAAALRNAALDPVGLAAKRAAAELCGGQIPSWAEVARQTAGLLNGHEQRVSSAQAEAIRSVNSEAKLAVMRSTVKSPARSTPAAEI